MISADMPGNEGTATILAEMETEETRQPASTAAPMLRVRLFGHISVEDSAGKTFLPRARKARAILAVLAMAAPRPVLRLNLTALLWSQREKEQARASLRQVVHELQDVFGAAWGHLLVAERHHLALRGEGLWVDALAASQGEAARPELLTIFRNVLLEDLTGLDPAFDRWLDEERRRLAGIARTLAEGVLSEQRDQVGAMDAAERLLAIDRTHEGAWRTLIRIHAERGDRAAALSCYERCCAALAEAAQLAPSADTEELVARIRAAEVGHPSPAAETPPAPVPPGPADTRSGRSGVRLGITPLRTIGASQDQELSVGLADEITTALARFRWISCVSGTSWAALGGERGRNGALSDLDLDFVLDGTIQRSAGRLRIMVRLLDMRSAGEVIWAGRFDREAGETLALQEEIGGAIVAQLDPQLLMHEGERKAARRLAEPTAQDLVLQAVPAIYRLERGGFHAAGRLLETALAADPGNSVAHAWYAYWHLFLVGQGWAEAPVSAAARAAELAERAVTLDPGDARALTLAGHVRSFLGKRAAEACALHDRAIELNPNLAIAWCFSGLACCYLGQHDEALYRMRQAIVLSPSDPHLFFFNMALIMPNLLRGSYEEAVVVGRRAIELNPWFSSSYKGHLSALGHLGRLSEAAETRARLLDLEPGFSVQDAIRRSPISRPEDLAHYAEGLRRAGLAEDETPAIDLVSPPPHSRRATGGIARASAWETRV